MVKHFCDPAKNKAPQIMHHDEKTDELGPFLMRPEIDLGRTRCRGHRGKLPHDTREAKYTIHSFGTTSYNWGVL